DRGCECGRKDLRDVRGVDEVDILMLGKLGVAGLVARVALVVLTGAELGGVDEQAHHHHVAALACCAEEREVALVEEAHRRHQADRATVTAGGREGLAEVALGANDPHGCAPTAPAVSARARSASASYIGR